MHAFPKPYSRKSVPDGSWPNNLFAFMITTSKRHQMGVSLVAISIAVLTVVPIELQRRIINHAIEGMETSLLLALAALFLLAITALQGFKFLLGTYQNWIAQTVILRMRKHLFPQQGCDDDDAGESSGNAVTVVGSEADLVGEFVGTGISNLVADGGKLIFAIGYMLYVEPLVTLVAIAFFIPQLILVPLIQKRLNHLVRERTDLMRTMSDDVSHAADGEGNQDAFNDALDVVFTNRAKSRSLKFAMKALVNFINSLAPLSVLVFGGWMYIQGDTTIGTIVAFMAGFERMAGPLRALVSYYRLASLRSEQYEKIVSWDEARSA